MSLACVAFVPADQEQHERRPVLAEVDAVAGAEHHARFLHAAANALVVAEVAGLEAKHARLDSRSGRAVERRQPLAKRDLPVGRFVFTDGQSHRARAKDKDIMNDNLWRRREQARGTGDRAQPIPVPAAKTASGGHLVPPPPISLQESCRFQRIARGRQWRAGMSATTVA